MTHFPFFLPSSYDTEDRTAEIEQLLSQYDTCLLGSGIYVVSGIRMPDGTSLTGMGSCTKLLLSETVGDGAAVGVDFNER